jgi:hypothetical protein
MEANDGQKKCPECGKPIQDWEKLCSRCWKTWKLRQEHNKAHCERLPKLAHINPLQAHH